MKDLGNIRNIKDNLVKMIADDWALVSAGDKENWNGMTISWGGIGELWGKDVVFVFIRPQRYTKEFMDRSDYFTVSFFDENRKDTLRFCGRNSGKDCENKMEKANLTPAYDGEAVYPNEAKTVLKCRKLAVQQLDPDCFLDNEIDSNYSAKDYHYVYIGEIEKVLGE